MIQKNVSEYYLRFAELCKIAGKTVTGTARELGKADSFFFTYRNPKRGFGDKVLIELEKSFGFNPEYIRLGADPKFTNEELYRKDLTKFIGTEDVEIELFNTPHHANLGGFVSFDNLPRTRIKYSRNLTNKNTRAIQIHTDCMIEIGIYSRDIIFFDIVDEDFNPVNGQMIIGNLNGCLLIKYFNHLSMVNEEINEKFNLIGIVKEIRRYV